MVKVTKGFDYSGWDEETLMHDYYCGAMKMIEYLQTENIEMAERHAMRVDQVKAEITKRGILFYPIEVCMGVGADLAAE
jgi:hypothetical protein